MLLRNWELNALEQTPNVRQWLFFTLIDNRSWEINQQGTVILKGDIWRIDHYYFIVTVFSNRELNSTLKKNDL